MMALVLALLSGALLAALICKGIKLKLWLDIMAGVGAVCATWSSAMLAGSDPWPLIGVGIGFVAVVAWLRVRPA